MARQRQPHERPVGATGVDLDVAEPEPALGVIGQIMGDDHGRARRPARRPTARSGRCPTGALTGDRRPHQGRWPSAMAGVLVINPFPRPGAHGA